MASWFTKALDVVTPWDRKGEVQRRKERQTTTSPAPTVVKPTPTPNIRTNASSNSLDVIKGTTKRPTDFGTLQVSNKVSVPNNMSVISNKTPNQAVKPTKQVEKVDSMKAITSNPSVKPTITNAVTQNRPTNRSINVISNNGVKPTFSNDFNKKVDAGRGKGLSTADTLKVTGTAAGRVGLDAAQGIVDLVTAPQKIQGWGLNKLTGNRFKEDIDLATGRYAANKMSRAFDTPREKLAKIRGDDANAKAVEQDAYVIWSLLTALSPTKLAKSVPGIGKKAWTSADNIMDGVKESPLIVDAIKNIKNLPKNISNIVRKSPKVEPAPTNIPVKEAVDRGVKIPTRVVEGKPIQDVTIRLPGETPALAPVPKPPVRTPEPSPLIQDVAGGETFATPDELVKRNVEQARREAADRFNSTDTGNMNDVTPRKAPEPYKVPDSRVKAAQDKVIDDYAAMLKNMGEGNGVSINPATGTRVSNNFRFPGTGSKRLTKAQWRDMAEAQLRSGSAEPGMQKGFDEVTNAVGDTESLLAKGEQVDVPIGKPIRVKEVKGIDVKQVTDVPTNTPEVPGTVRVSSQTDPMAAKTQAVANAPVVNTPAPIVSPETQAILANPKKFNKRQVKAARNQLKLAKAKAKADAQTQAVIDGMPNRATQLDVNGNVVGTATPQGNRGFVPTGELKKGVNGNVYEVAHNATEEAQAAMDTANLSAADVITQAQQEISQFGTVSAESARNLKGMISSGRFPQNSPEYIAMSKAQVAGGSKAGQTLSLFNKETRRTASGKELANRFISKLYGVSEDPTKLLDTDIARVNAAEDAFANARDAANRAGDQYNATKSAEDFAAWKQAKQAAQAAEENSLIEQFNIAQRVLKDNTDPAALKALQAAEKDAGVYQMDWIDANMLSGTGTGTRNYLNTAGIRIENSTLGRLAGGYSGKGAKLGNKIGNRQVVSDFKARNQLDGNKFVKGVKQWSTTMNTLGEGNIQAVAYGRAYKFYEKQLKAQGLTGDRLARDIEFMLDSDPQGMVAHYEAYAMRENALSALAHSKKIEQALANAIAGQGGGKFAQGAAKAAVRLTVGFPTVIGRSLVGGAKRATLGGMDMVTAAKAWKAGDKLAMTDALYSAKVHGGSGMMLYGIGYGLSEAGIITGPYPENDQAERDRWEAEGIQPNSIRIGGQYFSIPGYFGALAMPFMVPAYIKNATSAEDIVKGIGSAVMNLSPTESAAKFLAGIEGRAGDQWIKNTATSLARSVTPVGALLNQIARMTDSTKNDTTTKSDIENFLDSVAGGIPGVNNMVNTIAKTDSYGNELKNPNPIATFFGASGAVQKQGTEDVQQDQSVANETYAELDQYGVLQNESLMGLVDEKIQAQIARGQDLKPEQVKSIQKAVTKGISGSITADADSNWRENGDYATDRIARQIKLQMLEADPTAKPSDIAGLKIQIARDDVLEKNQVPYEELKSYQSIGVDEWRKMGIPPGSKGYDEDVYDQEMYQRLYEIDQMLTEAGGSYNSKDTTKPKYTAKSTGGSGSGGRSKKIDTNFGTLGGGGGATMPRVRQYETANISGISNIPIINITRPNIVRKIGTSE